MPPTNLLPACYDADAAARLNRAILQLHATCVDTPTTEAKLLAARDAAGHMAALSLGMAERLRATGDERGREAARHLLDALAALVAVRAVFERGDEPHA